jgi:membrane protease YdiL (CAAX protease family)
MAGHSLAAWVKRHPIITYLALAFGFTWACEAPLVAYAQGFITWAPSPYLHYLGLFGPLVAALAVTFLIAGRQGRDDIIARMFQWRGIQGWIVFAFILTPVLFAISILAIGAISGSFPDPIRFFEQTEIPGIPFYGLWLLFIVGGWGEEAGWRGFLLPRLQNQYSALASAVLVTLAWAPWHLMGFLEQDTFMNLGAFGTFGWLMGLLCGSIVFTWLYNSSGGSIMVVALAHGMLDVCTSIPNAGPAAYLVSMLFILVAIGAVVIGGPRNLARGRERQRSVIVNITEQSPKIALKNQGE